MNIDPTRAGNQSSDSLIGQTVDGKYLIESKLGEGGMGTVYLSTRLMIGDAVAVKILHSAQVSDPQAIERFRREAQAAARLKHQNAVIIYDFGVSNEGLVYLVMELAEGQSLRDIIKQQGPVTPSAAAEIMNQVCAALDAAHRQNIVHRDLKPDNIIVAVTNTGLRAKVLDFGIAKMRDLTASNLTQTGAVMGTPYYMSPEHCMGEELDHRSDIYSLGIVLFEMLAGVVPFNSPISTAVVVQHVNQAPPSLRALNASISPEVEAVVMRALAKRRDLRQQTAVHLAQELIAAVQGRPLTLDGGSMQVLPSYSTPASTTPAANPVAGAALAPTIQMTTPPSGISGARTQRPQKSRAGWLIGGVVLVAVIGLLIWASQRGHPLDTPKVREAPAPPQGMAYVPGTEFTMGNDAGDRSERPQHKVTVKPFFIDLHEVTCEEYDKFIRATSRQPPATWADAHYPSGWERRPVTGINWDDASAYAEWAGKRLPTEQEWEFAARGSDGRLYPWGIEWKDGSANAGPASPGHVVDVGTYPAGVSPFGPVDMVGNAWEWTASDFVAYPGSRLSGQATGTLKVIRGGCFLSRPDQATATIRVGWPARGGNEYDNTGFRCAKDPPATSQPAEAKVTATPPPVDFQGIRRVDFRNFTYPLDDYKAKNYGTNSVLVRNGRFIFSRDSDYGPDGFEVTKTIYGDLTGDSQEEAAVITAIGLIESGTSQQAPGTYAYIYTMENGRPALLKIYDSESDDSDANKYYRNHYRDNTTLLYGGVTRIESGLLVVESLAGAGRCCSEYEVMMKFRWDGQRFILAGNPQRKRMRQ